MSRGQKLARIFTRFPATWGIATLTLGVFVLQWWLGGDEHATSLSAQIRLGALRADRVSEHGEYFRLVMPIFLHHGWLHLVLNGFAFLQLGALVESLWGSVRMVGFYLLCGVAGTLASALFSPAWVSAVGASGAIMGLAGLLLGHTWFGAEPVRSWLREVLGRRLLYGVLLTFAIGIGLWLVLPVVDNQAHFGGFACGVLLSLANPDPTHREGPAPLVAFLMTLVTLMSFGWTARDGVDALETLEIDTARLLSAAASEAPDALRAPGAIVQMLDWYAQSGETDEGLEALKRVVSRMDTPWLVGQTVGVTIEDDRFDRETEVLLDRWLQLAPDDPQALNATAWHLVTRPDPSRRDPERAVALSRRSLERIEEPDTHDGRLLRATFLDTLAEALFQLERYDEALEAQRTSVELARELEFEQLDEMQERLDKIEAGAG